MNPEKTKLWRVRLQVLNLARVILRCWRYDQRKPYIGNLPSANITQIHLKAYPMSHRIALNRRSFLTACAGACAAATAFSGESQRRKRIAFLGTEVRTHSHAQHFLDRLSQGYAWKGRWVAPRVDIASVFIDQFPEGDLARSRAAKHNLQVVPTIADALTLGGSKLAVDGVVIIAEHGDYPDNEMGQKRYPRYAWFKEVVKVFEETGQSAPVFNDKHLSTRWSECTEMVADAQRLGFPFLAGSSLLGNLATAGHRDPVRR